MEEFRDFLAVQGVGLAVNKDVVRFFYGWAPCQQLGSASGSIRWAKALR